MQRMDAPSSSAGDIGLQGAWSVPDGCSTARDSKERGEQMQAYCLKCRTAREMKNAEKVTMKNGKPATKGVCPVCGTKMYKIGKA